MFKFLWKAKVDILMLRVKKAVLTGDVETYKKCFEKLENMLALYIDYYNEMEAEA